MNIKYTILGFLSWRPLTGYDLKKLFIDTIFIYWSGNNNQIYRTLVQLHHEKLVTNEVQHQENGPTRKIYTITEKGLSELRIWVQSTPELPQLRNSFLIQLAWADQLGPEELDTLLKKYEDEIHVQSLMYHEHKKRNLVNPARTKRETYLWSMISDNVIASYEHELAWIRTLRKELGE
ncbi:MAG: PadR family transcriptional regulator [Spirochaetales bacterium]|nr:PadR family transcriptional regulator [Spirochaetales bacterium]